jgi:hypothetical protein
LVLAPDTRLPLVPTEGPLNSSSNNRERHLVLRPKLMMLMNMIILTFPMNSHHLPRNPYLHYVKPAPLTLPPPPLTPPPLIHTILDHQSLLGDQKKIYSVAEPGLLHQRSPVL